MACGGNARGGLSAGMRSGLLPEGRAAEAPVWLPHAVIARGHRPEPGPFSSRLSTHDLGLACQNISPRLHLHPSSSGECRKSKDVRKGDAASEMSTFRSEIDTTSSGVVYLPMEVMVKPNTAS